MEVQNIMAQNDAKKLTTNQRKALAALLRASTVSKAALLAGLSERTVWRYLSDSTFKAELQRRQDETLAATTAALSGLSQRAIGALTQALDALAAQAGASLADFVQVTGKTWTLDLKQASDEDLLHLVKKLYRDKDGGDRLELHDAQSAAVGLGRLALSILNERRKSAELDDLAERVSKLEQEGGEIK